MKRLGMYVIIFVMLFGVCGNFVHPEKSFAQGTSDSVYLDAQGKCNSTPGMLWDETTQKCKLIESTNNQAEICNSTPGKTWRGGVCTNSDQTYDIEKGVQIFDNMISKIDSQKSNDPTYAKRYINHIQEAKNIFVDNYNNPKPGFFSGKPTTPENIYKQAMEQAYESLNASVATFCNGDPGSSKEGCDTMKALALVVSKSANPSTNFASTDTLESAVQKAESAGVVSKPKKECSILPKFTLTDCIDYGFAWLIKHTLLAVAGWVLWVAGTVMNYSIQVGILLFAKWAPDTLYPIWIVVRQIISLFIVFAGLYLGLMYIIGKDEKFEKYIPWVVIFALFVNFSYPLTRTLVDISNVVSLNIYTSAVGTDVLNNNNPESEKTAGAIIRNKLGLAGLIDYATGNITAGEGSLNDIDNTPGAILAVIFIGYAAYIFFVVTVLIITRTAALVFLIVASPILFVDSVIPKLGDQAVKVRKIFFEQLAVGPVFMIMLALTLKFLEVFQRTGAPLRGSDLSLDSFSSGGSSVVVTFFNLTMMLIMLHIMIKVTKSTSGTIGQMATDAVGKVGGFALGAAAGGAGMIGRAGIGRVAAKARDSAWMTNNQHHGLGRALHGISNSVATSSFDARNSSYVRTGVEKMGLNIGMGKNTNFEKTLDARIQDRKARYERIKTENPDGTTNEAGAEAKRIFFEKEGKASIFGKALGVSQTKKKVGEALLAVDKEIAGAQDKKLAAYDKRTGEAKQERYKDETSQAMKQQMIDHDRAQAEEENEKRDTDKKNEQYEKLSNRSKQIYYDQQTTDLQKSMEKKDWEEAAEINKKIDGTDKMKLEGYQNLTGEDRKQYYGNQPKYLQQKMKSSDEEQARATEKYRSPAEKIPESEKHESHEVDTFPA